MSKIICEVCGTSYPETATQCPICGCVRTANAKASVITKDADNTADSYTYVKGGRFSKANVRKRDAGTLVRSPRPVKKTSNNDENKKKAFIIAAIIFLVAVIIALIFVICNTLSIGDDANIPTTAPTQPSTPIPTDPEEPELVPCERIWIDRTSTTITDPDEDYLLNVAPIPSNSTDDFSFASKNPEIATVTTDGRITPVASGTAIIEIKCGSVILDFTVICDISTNVEPEFELKLNRADFTMSYRGEIWKLYDGELDSSLITWTSDNENVAVINNGIVEAVGGGMTTVYAEYNGQKVSCIVRCAFSNDSNSGSGGNVTEDGSGVSYFLKNTVGGSASDVTLKPGESFRMQLVNSDNQVIIDATWTCEIEGICTVNNGLVVGVASGITKVFVSCEGMDQPLIFTVRVP